MATASTKKNESKDPREKLVNPTFYEVIKLHGIKTSPVWKWPNRYDFTYFVLPEPPSTYVQGEGHFEVKDFIGFWHQMDDIQKVRRLLAYYSIASQIVKIQGDNNKEEMNFDYYFLETIVLTTISNISIDMGTELLSLIHRLFINNQGKRGIDSFARVVELFYQAYINNNKFANAQCFHQYLKSIVSGAVRRQIPFTVQAFGPQCAKVLANANLRMAGLHAEATVKHMVDDFVAMYFIWKSLNEKGKKRYLKKLRVSAPHWRKKDRVDLLRVLESKSQSPQGTYITTVLNRLGSEKFKLIAFGKEKFCSNCGRSSYVGEDRLWCCKRCAQERKRPKARYCNVQCQKAHWLKHKLQTHSGK